ncbi:outer membrane protein [Methylobacterium sp. A54F]
MIRQILLAGAATAVLAGAASAADLPRRAAPPVFTPIPVFTWTGFYAGTYASYGITDNGAIRTVGNNGAGAGPLLAPNFTNTVSNVALGRRAPSFSAETDKVGRIGGNIGYNYQFTPGSGIVVGVEASWTWTDLTRGRTYISGLNDPSVYRQSLDWLGTATGRVGYAFDRFLVYGTGGFAYGNVFYDARFLSNNAAAGFPLAYAGRYDDLETGYAYGGGIEYAIPTDSFLNVFSIGKYLGIKSEAVTFKAEYLHYDLGSRNVLVSSINPSTGAQFVATANGSYTTRFRTEGDIIKAGLNYKFGGF